MRPARARRFVGIVVAFVLAAGSAHAAPDPDARRLVATEWFDIVFRERDRYSAERLAGFADAAYEELAARLEVDTPRRLTIVLGSSLFMTSYDPMSSGVISIETGFALFGSLGGSLPYEDALESAFRREAAKALALGKVGAFQGAVAAAFGRPLDTTYWTAPPQLGEGSGALFESREGLGRAEDPIVGAVVRQDILEGGFKDFTRVSGVRDTNDAERALEAYGARFARWLVARFGPEKYAELWRRVGAGFPLEPFGRLGPFRGAFESVYAATLDDAWRAFGADEATRAPVRTDATRVAPVGMDAVLCAAGNRLYYADCTELSVRSLDPTTGAVSPLAGMTPAFRLSASADGTRLLVSTIGLVPTVVEFDTERGTRTGTEWEGLGDAAFAGPGRIVAVRMDGMEGDLVLSSPDGERVLAEAGPARTFFSPCAEPDGSAVYALVREAGVVSILRFSSLDAPDGPVAERLSPPPGTTWIRYLSFGDGVLRAAWDDGSFYRLLEIEAGETRRQTVPLSGGVHAPVALGSSVYYLGRFSGGDAVCRFPSDRAGFGFEAAPAEWLPYRPAPDPAPADDARAVSVERPYGFMAGFAPYFWHPTVALSSGKTIGAAGFAAYATNPTRDAAATVAGGWSFDVSVPEWAVSMDFGLSPLVSFGLVERAARDEAADLADVESAARVGLYLDGGKSVGLSGGFLGLRAADGSGGDFGPWTTAYATARADLALALPFAKAGERGISSSFSVSLGAQGAWGLDDERAGRFRFGAGGEGRLSLGALSVGLGGGYAATAGAGFGPDGYALEADERWILEDRETYRPMGGLASPSGDGVATWYVQGETALRLARAPVDALFGPAYLNGLSVHAGVRGALAPEALWHDDAGFVDWRYACFGRLSLDWAPAIGFASRMRLRSFLDVWYAPETGEYGVDFTFGGAP